MSDYEESDTDFESDDDSCFNESMSGSDSEEEYFDTGGDIESEAEESGDEEGSQKEDAKEDDADTGSDTDREIESEGEENDGTNTVNKEDAEVTDEQIQSEVEEACDEEGHKKDADDINDANKQEDVEEPSQFEKALTTALAKETGKAVADIRKVATKQIGKSIEAAGTGALKKKGESNTNKAKKAEPKSSEMKVGEDDNSTVTTKKKKAKKSISAKADQPKSLMASGDHPISSTAKSNDDSKVIAKKKVAVKDEDRSTADEDDSKTVKKKKKKKATTSKTSSALEDDAVKGGDNDPKTVKKKKPATSMAKEEDEPKKKIRAKSNGKEQPTEANDDVDSNGKEAKMKATNPTKDSDGKLDEDANTSKTSISDEVQGVASNSDDIYFWNVMGMSFMACPGRAIPAILQKDGNDCAKFSLVTVDAAASKVAIKSTKRQGYEQYLSCGRKKRSTNSAFSGFSSQIGDKETFIMTHCETDNTFLFRSHNNLYLHYAEDFHSVVFKPCSNRDKNDIPIKGRWQLFSNVDRVGTKNGFSQTAYQASVGWAVGMAKAGVKSFIL